MKNWFCLSILAAAVPLALAMSVPVHAQSADGYLNDDIALRAGPAPEYPEIEGLPYGTYVSVQGCTDGWEWCDVIAEQGDRGWVPGDYIDYEYEGQPVEVTTYGPRIGIPIVSFSIATYWDAHYRNRPFYSERESWFHRSISHRAPPPHHEVHRNPPPPPPGGWHHGSGHALPASHHGSTPQPFHHDNLPQPSHHGNVPQPQHHGSVPQPPHEGYTPASPHHENPPNPPRAPVNLTSHPQGDHHANISPPRPMTAPTHPVPPHNSHVQPHSSSSTDHGKHPQHPKKKDDHNNGNDNGH